MRSARSNLVLALRGECTLDRLLYKREHRGALDKCRRLGGLLPIRKCSSITSARLGGKQFGKRADAILQHSLR